MPGPLFQQLGFDMSRAARHHEGASADVALYGAANLWS